MSTMIPKEDTECVIQPDPSYSVLNESDEVELRKLIRVHNSNISGVVDEFSGYMDDLKAEIQKEKGSSKKRKIV